MGVQTDRQTDRQDNELVYRQTDRQDNGWIDVQTDRHTGE